MPSVGVRNEPQYFSALRLAPRWASFLSPTYKEYLPKLWSVETRNSFRRHQRQGTRQMLGQVVDVHGVDH